MADCIFCKIAAGEIPSKKAYEDDQILAFYDLDPQAPVHILIIPKEHISSANELTEENGPLLGHIFAAAAKLAKELGLEKGYRIVNNCAASAFSSAGRQEHGVASRLKAHWFIILARTGI